MGQVSPTSYFAHTPQEHPSDAASGAIPRQDDGCNEDDDGYNSGKRQIQLKNTFVWISFNKNYKNHTVMKLGW